MGAGGSRYGAGRPGWRRKCELSLPLDIRKLHRIGRLSAGQSFGWHWTQGDEPCGNIGILTESDCVELSYTWTPRGGSPQSKFTRVRLERTPCRYGGSRAWFHCPWCSRRCAILYGLSGDGYFGCRLCLRLAYTSEAEDACGRLWRKQRKLEARLTEHDGKPKWMRARTFDRIYEKIVAVEEAWNRAFLAGAARLFARLDGTPTR